MFFGWHRSYLALYEQELYKHIQSIALRFPSTLAERYIAAAAQFRVPYWDWALGVKGGGVPYFFLSPTIQVIATDGSGQTIPNPLHHFEFHPLIPGAFDGKWAQYNTTLRWPTSNEPNAQSQNEKFEQDFEAHRRGYLDKVSNAFVFPKSMNDFSTKYSEDIHGWIHFAIGGEDRSVTNDRPTGHMWPSEYSAFEPLFMLHHCNVDRLFALWQAAHPDRYVEPANVHGADNKWIEINSVVDADTPLLPFWNTPNSFWTTNEVKDTAVFGYVYPETQKWKYDSDGAYRAAVNASIAQLYSSSSRSMLTAGPNGAQSSLHHLLAGDTFVDWIIHIEGSRLDLPATFIAEFFLVGDFSSDTVTDVGAWSVLMPARHNAEERKVERTSSPEPDMKGMVSLTASLLDHIAPGKLESLEARDVVPYLTDKLTWKVHAGDGTAVHQNNLEGLTIEIISTNVRIPNDPAQLLEYSDEWVLHPEVTLGKSGGVKA